MILAPRPEVPLAQRWDFPQPRIVVLDNGVTVHLFHMPGQHLITTTVLMDVPTSVEDDGLDGISAVVSDTVSDGTLSFPGFRFLEECELYAAKVGSYVTDDSVICTVAAPGIHLQPVLTLLCAMMGEPELNDHDVDRTLAITKSQLHQQLFHAGTQADLGIQRALCSDQTRFGRPVDGSLATLDRITAADVRSFYSRYWGPQRATAVIAGDLPVSIEAILNRTLGTWMADNLPIGRRHEKIDPKPHCVQIIDFPDAVQAEIRMTVPIGNREDPRWPAFNLGALLLGGFFGSRLNLKLREEHGYTYGAHAYADATRLDGALMIATSSRIDVAVKAVDEILRILDIGHAPFSDDDIAQAQNYRRGISPLSFQTASSVARQVSHLIDSACPIDYMRRFEHAYQTLSADQVNQAYEQILNPVALRIVIAGPAEQLETDIRALGFDIEVSADPSAAEQ